MRPTSWMAGRRAIHATGDYMATPTRSKCGFVGHVQAYGWVVDMGDLERRLQLVHVELDHRFLNDVDGLGAPTMENIAAFVWGKLTDLPQLHRVLVKRQQNGEGCEYFGPVSEAVS